MSLKKPSDFFERKRNEELARKKLEEEEKLKNRKVVPPQEFFGGEEEVIEEVIVESHEIEGDPFDVIREEIKKVSASIPEKTDLTEVFQEIEILKNKIDDIPEQVTYDGAIELLRAEIRDVEDNIPIPEKFDASELYENISSLKEKLEEVKSEIPIIPEVKYYDDDLDKIRELVEEVKNSIPEVPEIRYYEEELNLVIDAIEEVKKEIPVVPEVRYYEKEISLIEERLIEIQRSIPIVPEVRYYDEEIQDVKNTVKEVREEIPTVPEVKYYDEEIKDLDDKISSVEGSIPEVKYYDEEIKGINKEIRGLYKKFTSIRIPDQEEYVKEAKELYASFEKKNQRLQKKIDHLEEVFGKFNEEVLTEGLLNIPPDVDNSDPLTPLDKNYATLQDLQNQYRIFINRIQQQLATLGGGGIGDAPYDGEAYVRKNYEWVLSSSSGGSGGKWESDSVGINTSSNIGIGTTARSAYPLYVQGDIFTTGDLNVTGDLTYDEVNARNWNISGVATAARMQVGAGTTWPEDLVVNGDARILGILTVGSSSIIIDGESEEIIIGGEDNVRISNSKVTIGSGVTISATASGINSAPNVLYVAKDGNDDNNGTSIDNAKLTISAAVGIAEQGTTVKVLSGNYTENNPIEVPAFVAIVGDDQRSVTVAPNNNTSNIFHVRKGVKLANMTFTGHLSPSAAVAFPTGDDIAENVNGGIWKGPYVQNCTSNTTTGTGIYIDGNQARSLKAMNVDSFTQYNQGGVGVAVTNEGFAQLVSVFTICCDKAISCHEGGQADLANSNCSFGTYGLVAKGIGPTQYTGIVTSSAAVSQDTVELSVTSPTLSINNFAYDNISGIATVTTTTPHGFLVGMGVTLAGIAVTCGAGRSAHTFVSGITSAITANTSAKYTASSGTTYDPLTGVMVIGIGSHSLTTSNTITIDNGGLTFTCDADSNATEHAYPRATDPISGISTAITAVSATTITVNVGAVSGSNSKTYPEKAPYVFEVESVPSTTSFSVNVGVSKHIHNYVSGGTAKIDIDRPYDGQVIYFDTLYNSVQTISVTARGSGYTSTPTITIADPSGPNGQTATAFATLDGDKVSSITIISSGSQYTSTPNVTISGGGGSSATATANMAPIYYTINSSTPLISGITTVTLDENLLNTVGVGSTAYFAQSSRIVASSHTFEYVGSGNEIVNATPKRGGVTNQANEVITQNGGRVVYTSTDQSGNFRIGDGLQINQNTGTISGRSFTKSLFTEMTPFILALS